MEQLIDTDLLTVGGRTVATTLATREGLELQCVETFKSNKVSSLSRVHRNQCIQPQIQPTSGDARVSGPPPRRASFLA